MASIEKEEDVLLGGADILKVQMNLEINSVRSMKNWGHLQFGVWYTGVWGEIDTRCSSHCMLNAPNSCNVHRIFLVFM